MKLTWRISRLIRFGFLLHNLFAPFFFYIYFFGSRFFRWDFDAIVVNEAQHTLPSLSHIFLLFIYLLFAVFRGKKDVSFLLAIVSSSWTASFSSLSSSLCRISEGNVYHFRSGTIVSELCGGSFVRFGWGSRCQCRVLCFPSVKIVSVNTTKTKQNKTKKKTIYKNLEASGSILHHSGSKVILNGNVLRFLNDSKALHINFRIVPFPFLKNPNGSWRTSVEHLIPSNSSIE